VRETAVPLIKRIPAAKLPPDRVRRVNIEEIKRERRVVPEERGSVFRPQRPPENMPVKRSSEPKRVVRPQTSPAAPQQEMEGRGGERREERPRPATPPKRGPESRQQRQEPAGVPGTTPQTRPSAAPSRQVPAAAPQALPPRPPQAVTPVQPPAQRRSGEGRTEPRGERRKAPGMSGEKPLPEEGERGKGEGRPGRR
jgi:hypothetical protein